ncbi:Calx-beta domain-containing protein [Oscillatoria acuminata]|uniref:Calx-beta domain-containing protein,putative calcium-binding protein n=1 Tax=Oscillatoria acuminata PCC 6304 TaxID=56110 RepID=K9TG17_9CYAN|nr:Calx-beta domain-containing protein [Oscillatoria acuminata]AFY81787.1 Calx-beta domain-containing protein,putative calcium-binding protein [Oscillatoria acuminata PCC 6304]
MTVIQGTPFGDSFLGTPGNDFIYGWEGNDVLNGAEGDDILYGDQGDDTLIGGPGNDLLAGGQGNDILNGGEGNDILYGGAGDDILVGGLGSDRLFGEAGLDIFYLEWGADTVIGGQDKDTFILFPTLGGDTLVEAAVITDFNPLEDELELANGLTFEGLNIFQGTENYANDTIIQDRNTGRYLAILLNVATPSFVPEATEETPAEETEVPAAEATEQPDIVFASPSVVMSPITQPGTPTDNTPIDDSIPGTLQFTASQFAVNEDGTSVITITVERIEGSAGAVGATITLLDGTATAPDDYDNTPISVNFADGDTTPKTIEVPMVDDTLIEEDETVNLTLFNPTGGASLGSQNTAILTIIDNDRPSQIQFSTPTYSIREDGGSATITIIRDRAIGIVSVDYATQTPNSNNAATADADYIPIQGTLTFNPGETTKTVTIPLLDDDLVEETETVQIALSNPSIGAILGENTTAILEIVDHEPGLLEFISASSSGLEGNSGTAVDTVVGKIRRSGGSDGEVTVQVVLDNPAGTATSGEDYTTTFPITVTFADGESSDRDVVMTIVGDFVNEPDETIPLQLVNPSNGARLGTQSTTIYTLVNDDGGINIPTASNFIAENITIPGGTSHTFTIDYTDNSAIDISSLDNSDILVTQPDGSQIPATFVSVNPLGDGTPRTVTYQIAASGGSWDTADNGTYTVQLQPNQVTDTTGNAISSATLGSFNVNLDTIVPTASNLGVTNVNTSGGTSHSFTVDYADNVAIALSSLDSSDIQVTGPNGFATLATLVSVNSSENGTPRKATYEVIAPGGTWDMGDNGTYAIALVGNQVFDTSGNAVPASNLGNFTVNSPLTLDPTVTLEVSPDQVYEDSGTAILYTFTRTDSVNTPLTSPLTANFTVGGTATFDMDGNGDYNQTGADTFGATGSVTFAPNASTAIVAIAPSENTQIEPNKTVEFTLTTGAYHVGTTDRVTGVIIDDDALVLNNNDSGYGSLRQAMINANTQGGSHVIDMTLINGNEIILESPLPLINSFLTVIGPRADLLTISGNNLYQVFYVNNDAAASFHHLTIAEGNNPLGPGGGIYNNGGLVQLINSVVNNNFVSDSGGGIFNLGGEINITASTISNNSSSLDGGGIWNSGTLNITNSTISGNSADSRGGGIYNESATVNITNSTISNNSVNSTGSGIMNNNGIIHAKNTIIAGNEDIDVFHPDFSGVLSSGGYNLIGNTWGGSGFAPTDILNVNPMLDPLANYGGTTPTHRLQPGSPAIDAGDATFPSPYISPLPFDQRGEGFNRMVNGLIDIGSYEYLGV